MGTSEQVNSTQIVPAGSQGLTVRSAALVHRGLRDLSRDSNWLIRKAFTGRTPHLAVSPTGQVCAISPSSSHGTQRVVLYDIELSVSTLALSVPREAHSNTGNLPASFAWSPTSRYLVAAWSAWQPELHLFDLNSKMLLGAFGEYRAFPAYLAWSETGKYFVAASSGGKLSSLRLWTARREENSLSGAPHAETGVPESIEAQAAGDEFADEGSFSGYGRTQFSPDEKSLATVLEVKGDWADDFILIAEAPSLARQNTFAAQGHITDLSWTPDAKQIVYCAAGQAYRLQAATSEFEPLPFGAELCACHPHLPLGVFFSSWLKNSAKGRLFLADLNNRTVFDEYAAEGIVDLRWSLDGSRAYAVSRDGLAYIYEPPLI
jgi:Tol biopolymer transport system component